MGISSLLLIAGCATRGDVWTEEAAMAPVLRRMDPDGDGLTTPAEYDAIAFYSPRFEKLDADGDGTLSRVEQIQAYYEQDPVKFLAFPHGSAGATIAVPDPQFAYDVFETITEEIRAKDPTAVLPTEAVLRDASDAGGMEGEAGRAALAQLRRLADAAQVPIPAALRAP